MSFFHSSSKKTTPFILVFVLGLAFVIGTFVSQKQEGSLTQPKQVNAQQTCDTVRCVRYSCWAQGGHTPPGDNDCTDDHSCPAGYDCRSNGEDPSCDSCDHDNTPSPTPTPKLTVAGTVKCQEDLNNDGEAELYTLSNIKVELFKNDGSSAGQANTPASGAFSYANQARSTYAVRIVGTNGTPQFYDGAGVSKGNATWVAANIGNRSAIHCNAVTNRGPLVCQGGNPANNFCGGRATGSNYEVCNLTAVANNATAAGFDFVYPACKTPAIACNANCGNDNHCQTPGIVSGVLTCQRTSGTQIQLPWTQRGITSAWEYGDGSGTKSNICNGENCWQYQDSSAMWVRDGNSYNLNTTRTFGGVQVKPALGNTFPWSNGGPTVSWTHPGLKVINECNGVYCWQRGYGPTNRRWLRDGAYIDIRQAWASAVRPVPGSNPPLYPWSNNGLTAAWTVNNVTTLCSEKYCWTFNNTATGGSWGNGGRPFDLSQHVAWRNKVQAAPGGLYPWSLGGPHAGWTNLTTKATAVCINKNSVSAPTVVYCWILDGNSNTWTSGGRPVEMNRSRAWQILKAPNARCRNSACTSSNTCVCTQASPTPTTRPTSTPTRTPTLTPRPPSPTPTPVACINNPADIVLALDRSGSMSLNASVGTVTKQKLEWEKDATNAFVDALSTLDNAAGYIQIGVVDWAGKSVPDAAIRTLELTNNFRTVRNHITGTTYNGNDSFTCISCAIQKAAGLLTNSTNRKIIVLMSDGIPNRLWGWNGSGSGDITPPNCGYIFRPMGWFCQASEQPTFAEATRVKNTGATIFVAGYGSLSNAPMVTPPTAATIKEANLRRIASTPDHYYYISDNVEDWDNVLVEEIATEICPDLRSKLSTLKNRIPSLNTYSQRYAARKNIPQVMLQEGAEEGNILNRIVDFFRGLFGGR